MKRFVLESKLMNEGYDAVFGCDEVGRGSLAGPVVAAAVYFDKPFEDKEWWGSINDSKKISPAIREELALEIISNSKAWGIGMVSNDKIDDTNIHIASLNAMKLAVVKAMKKINSTQSHLLIDGRFEIPKWQGSQTAIVKGDSEVHSIAAASIIAKVYRDNLMRKMHDKFPLYGFNSHKGYATSKHRDAIRTYGVAPVHRVSFCGNIV